MAPLLGALVRIRPLPTCASLARNLPHPRGPSTEASSRLPAPSQRLSSPPGLGPLTCSLALATGRTQPGESPKTGARACSQVPLGRERGRSAVSPRMAASSSREAARVAASLPCPPEYRANVGICLVNRSGLVFVASRIDKPGAWQMPQGGIDAGEEPEAAARRELREETGVTSADLIAEVPDWLCYDFPPDVRAKLAVAWGKDWKGQAQKWFLFRYTGADDSEVSLAGDGSEKPEFEEWKWMEVPGVIAGAVEFKQPVYEAAFKVFLPYIQQ